MAYNSGMGCRLGRLAVGAVLVFSPLCVTAQQPPGPASVEPSPSAPQARAAAAETAPSGDTPTGASLDRFRQQLQRPASTLKVASATSVATFRVSVRPDYRAEFQSRLAPIFELTPEEKRAVRLGAGGAGFDPLVVLNAYRRVKHSLEAARARREVEQALAEFRKLEEARRKAAEEQEGGKK